MQWFEWLSRLAYQWNACLNSHRDYFKRVYSFDQNNPQADFILTHSGGIDFSQDSCLHLNREEGINGLAMLRTGLKTNILVFQQFSVSVEHRKYVVIMNHVLLKIGHKKCGLWSMHNGTQDCNLTGVPIVSAAHDKLMLLVPYVHNLRCVFRAFLFVIIYYKKEWNAKWARNSEWLAFFSLDTFSYLSEHLEIQPSLSSSNS
jgi:hypothetical protein